MENVYYSLKDFELSLKKSAIERADDFQQYINQLNEFGCKSYWITSQTGVGSINLGKERKCPIINRVRCLIVEFSYHCQHDK